MTSDNSKETRARRKREADARQAQYSALDAEGKLLQLNRNLGVTKPVGAVRERAKLEKLAAAGK